VTPAAVTHSAGTPSASTASTVVPAGGGAAASASNDWTLLERQATQVDTLQQFVNDLELIARHRGSPLAVRCRPAGSARPALNCSRLAAHRQRINGQQQRHGRELPRATLG
jgi:hypothetical protein